MTGFFLGFLLKVLEKINFGLTFVTWVKMLHNGANTSFILLSLTAAIEVSFSIRQGDPLAMLLYVVYLEPLLVNLERVLTGLQLRRQLPDLGPQDAYCDDLNIMTNDLDDFPKIDLEIQRFESFSGAILSRNSKSKVIGFGGWRNKEDWPIPWLACQRSLKVFGIYVSDSYNEILKLYWDHRLQEFKNAIFSWSSRALTTLQQRIEIVKIFALSRTYYVASIFPLRVGYVKKFETVINKFIWSRPYSALKVAFDELKNKKLDGGLQLPCLATMGQALLTSQCLRLLKTGDKRYVCHLDYWLGALLGNVMPDMGIGIQARSDNPYFSTLGDYLASLLVSGFLNAGNLRMVTNKQIYNELSNFPVPKVVRDAALVMDFKPVWQRVHSSVLNSDERQIWYLFIHNKLPIQE